MSSDDELTVAVFRTQAAADMAVAALQAAGLSSWIEQPLPGNRLALRVKAPDAEQARDLLAATRPPPASPTSELEI